MLFSGTSCFSMQNQLNTEKAKTRIEMAEATNNLAKMRFNIGVEKAMQVDIQRDMEEAELR